MIFTIAWAVLAAAAIGFEIFTAVATKNQQGTLSSNVWKYVTGVGANAKVPPWLAWVNRVILLALLAWLAGHLGFGLWAP